MKTINIKGREYITVNERLKYFRSQSKFNGWQIKESLVHIDEKEGMIVGENGTILHTVNGGSTWSNMPSGTKDDLYAVCRSPGGSLYAVGQWGTVLKY